MHYKIIFIGMEERIIFNKGILEEVDGEYKRLFYKINEDTVEALFFNGDYIGVSNSIGRESIVVVNDSGSLSAEVINAIQNNKDVILVVGKNNNKIVNFDKEFIFTFLAREKEIEIYDIILTLYNIFEHDSIFKNTSIINGVIGFSVKENLQQDILVNVLNEFKIIEKCSEYYLNILLKEELRVDEIAYIEDPIMEYKYKNSKFKINQKVDEKYKDKIYFSMIGI